MRLRSKKKFASYYINGFIVDSFIGEDGVEYLRLLQRRVDHGFGKPRWETPLMRVPPNAIKLRELPP